MSDSNAAPDSVRQDGDDRLVDALLVHLHDQGAAAGREQRVRNVIDRLAGRSSDAPHTAHRWRLGGWVRRGAGIAAMLLLVAGLWVMLYQPSTAAASINDILGSLGRPGDRTYRIAMTELPEPPGSPREAGPAVPRPGLDGATLYLRDGKAYLLVRQDPNNAMKIFDGYDGRQSFRVRNGVLGEIKDGLGAGGIPMPSLMADIPFSDLHQTLGRIRVDYSIDRLDHAPLPAGGDPLRHVLVRRNSRAVKGPETIEIWADAATALPRRIVFDHAKVQGNRAPCRITLDLASEESLPPNWFSPAPHVTRR